MAASAIGNMFSSSIKCLIAACALVHLAMRECNAVGLNRQTGPTVADELLQFHSNFITLQDHPANRPNVPQIAAKYTSSPPSETDGKVQIH